MSDDEREEKELDLTSPEVVTKYKSAAEIVNSNFPALYINFNTTVKYLAFEYSCTFVDECIDLHLGNFAEALQLVISGCKPKAKIVDLCEKGDSYIRE